jgi:hypothetical protein
MPWALRKRPAITIQKFIGGRETTSAVAAWKGSVVGCLNFEVVHTWKPGGPASVLRLVRNPAMSAAAETLASRLKLSGFFGLDFILESGSGRPFLIELNPRATQTCHLPLGPGQDLPVAIADALAGRPPSEPKPATRLDLIALFPLEWQRNPASPFLRCAYHDVPWSEPELVRLCLRDRSAITRWYSADSWSEAISKLRSRFLHRDAPSKDANL